MIMYLNVNMILAVLNVNQVWISGPLMTSVPGRMCLKQMLVKAIALTEATRVLHHLQPAAALRSLAAATPVGWSVFTRSSASILQVDLTGLTTPSRVLCQWPGRPGDASLECAPGTALGEGAEDGGTTDTEDDLTRQGSRCLISEAAHKRRRPLYRPEVAGACGVSECYGSLSESFLGSPATAPQCSELVVQLRRGAKDANLESLHDDPVEGMMVLYLNKQFVRGFRLSVGEKTLAEWCWKFQSFFRQDSRYLPRA